MFKKVILSATALILLFIGNQAIAAKAFDHVYYVPQNIQSVNRTSFSKTCIECHAASYDSFDHTKPFFYAGKSYFVDNDTMKELEAPHGRYSYLGDGSEVQDGKTGLVWQRCVAGMSWNGTTCTGKAATYTYDTALAYAK